MAIQSDAFSRVDLTGEDAKKFKLQVTFGRPKAVAQENIERGVNIVRNFHKNGSSFVFKAKIK